MPRLAGVRAPRAGVGRVGAEVGEDLVDHRRLGDARDAPHGPATRRTRERVDTGNPPARLESRNGTRGNSKTELTVYHRTDIAKALVSEDGWLVARSRDVCVRIRKQMCLFASISCRISTRLP